MIDTITVSAVNPKMVGAIWPMVQGLIEQALKYSNKEMTLDSVFKKIEDSEMALIVVLENSKVMAALTVENNNFPSGKKVLNITTAGGADMHMWLDQALEVCEGIAAQHGCDEIYVIGRSGWSKALKSKGFETIHTVMSKKVGE